MAAESGGVDRNYEPQSLAGTAATSEPSSCKASVCSRSRFSAAVIRCCQVCTQTNSSVPTGNEAVSYGCGCRSVLTSLDCTKEDAAAPSEGLVFQALPTYAKALLMQAIRLLYQTSAAPSELVLATIKDRGLNQPSDNTAQISPAVTHCHTSVS